MRDVAGEEASSPAYLTFHLGEQTLGIDVRDVRELLVPGKITPLPDAPIGVLGVVDLRGTPLPVVDLKAWHFVNRMERGWPDRRHRCCGWRKPLGILTGRVRKVDQIRADEIEPCPSIGANHWDSSIIEGLSRRGSDLIILIQIDGIFGGMMDGRDRCCHYYLGHGEVAADPSSGRAHGTTSASSAMPRGCEVTRSN
ncbi:chemotaxis protein CheW [Palleronia marisminoris]|uniref:chemotaxis protein CheW n=1 Tax=Palleronia marisminoris TaxID=315423 RepID=UPI0015938E0F|nr:chemotaxis protein CheW [Palleronia marisminoris]